MALFRGTKHDDDFTGTTGNDTFNLYKGGSDTVHADDGNDRFNMGASLDATDRLDGGAGRDVVWLHGDYSAGVTFDADTISNVEVLRLADGFDYKLVLADGNVAPGERLTVNAAALGAGHGLTFDGSAESDGHFSLYGGAGDDDITGGQKADKIFIDRGGNDTVHAGDGNDTIAMGTAFGTSFVDGGAGDDTVIIGNSADPLGNLTVDASHFGSIEAFVFRADFSIHDPSIVFTGNFTTGGSTLTIDTRGVIANVDLDLTGVTRPALNFIGQGTATITGNLQAGDHFDGGDHSGGGETTLNLTADLSAGYTFAAGQLLNISALNLTVGDTASLTMSDDVRAGYTQFITIDTDDPTGLNLTFDGSAETDGFFEIWTNAKRCDLTGGGQADEFHLTGNTDVGTTIHGGGGDDFIDVGDHFRFFTGHGTPDVIDGGAGDDTLMLAGNYSGALHTSQFQSIETLVLGAGFDYGFTQDDAVSGATFTVDGEQLGSGDTLYFNAVGDTDTAFHLTGGAGDDDLTGAAGNDVFDLSRGGDDTVQGGGGNDTFQMGIALSAGDTIFGGTGTDTMVMGGPFNAGTTLALSTTNLHYIDVFRFDASSGVTGVTFSGDFNTTSLTLDASAMGTDPVSFDFSAATSGSYLLTGSAGNDTFTLSSSGANTVTGGLGVDTTACTTQVDTFVFASAAESTADTSGHADHVNGFNGLFDKFDLPFAVNYQGSNLVGAANDFGDFAATMDSAFAPGEHDAAVFVVLSGALAGHSYLIVDFDGNGAWSAVSDLAIDITGFSGGVSGANFI